MPKWGYVPAAVIGALFASCGLASDGSIARQHTSAPAGVSPAALSQAMDHATLAASQPARWEIPALSGNLEILGSRSIFLHGRPPPLRVATTQAANGEARSGPAFVLRGVARQGEQLMALVEDVAGNQTRQMHIGDALAGGKLVAITTDGVDESLAGKIAHVKVGQPLDAGGTAGPNTAGPATQPALAQQGAPAGGAQILMVEQASSLETPVPAGVKLSPDKD